MLYCPFQEKKACRPNCALYIQDREACTFHVMAESLRDIAVEVRK